MAYTVEEIEGIGPAYAKKLADAGIATTDNLLDACGDAKGREAVAAKTGISAKVLLTWANMADLMRISGVGEEYSQLLEAAGIDTVKELRNRNAENLAARMEEVNAEKKLTRRAPSAKEVAKWVEQSKGLPPRISY
jgi:predicted flap endonuclease-1-like 5' DNA nuclease